MRRWDRSTKEAAGNAASQEVFFSIDKASRNIEDPLLVNKKELKRFREILTNRRTEILKAAEVSKERGMGFSSDDLPDEVDLASSESDQSLNLRLRDRERVLFKKIEKALKKIDEGEYGTCERCGEDIDAKRLEARPVTDLCIRCKEEEERMEKSFAE